MKVFQLQIEMMRLGFQKELEKLKKEHDIEIKAKDNRIEELEFKIELLNGGK